MVNLVLLIYAFFLLFIYTTSLYTFYYKFLDSKSLSFTLRLLNKVKVFKVQKYNFRMSADVEVSETTVS